MSRHRLTGLLFGDCSQHSRYTTWFDDLNTIPAGFTTSDTPTCPCALPLCTYHQFHAIKATHLRAGHITMLQALESETKPHSNTNSVGLSRHPTGVRWIPIQNAMKQEHNPALISGDSMNQSVPLHFQCRDCSLLLRDVNTAKETWGLHIKEFVGLVSVICFYLSSKAMFCLSPALPLTELGRVYRKNRQLLFKGPQLLWAERCYSGIILALSQALTDLAPGQCNSNDLLLIYHGPKENLTLLPWMPG